MQAPWIEDPSAITDDEAVMLPGDTNIEEEAKDKNPEIAVQKIRTYFPERWLWDLVIIGSSGVVEKKVSAPDTLTTWLTSAFAVHPLYGLSVTAQAAELTTSQDLFVSLDLPYSAVRGEDVCLKAAAFNYHNKPLQMRMMLGQADGLENVVLEPAALDSSKLVETRRSVMVTRDLGLVAPNTTKETDFCFTPTKVGDLPIRVNLTSSVPGDGVEYTLKVEPEGSPQVQTVTVLLDAKPNISVYEICPSELPLYNGSRVTGHHCQRVR
ncbi:CD109 antigen-like [Pomacea canaliculata]|uniref:CD109 antigen-like n=1 Tax=Pomacea canaliculata TaxID=400727 RepID=UPI000D73BD3D|nr:CD109 antigen-like [Pomacea canaliculata]